MLLLLPSAMMVVNIFFAIVVVFYERRNPAVTWSWLMVITLVPYIGFVFYLMVGLDSRKYRLFSAKAKKDELLVKQMMEQSGDSMERQLKLVGQKNILQVRGSEHYNDMIYLNIFSGGGLFSKNNHVSLFHEGGPKFDDLLEGIRTAKRFIHLEYYIVRNDDIGQRLVEALAIKAAEGLDVRFMYDGMGSVTTPKRMFRPLAAAGGKVTEFMRPHFFRINFRNHRKICVIDGETAYIGGLNIGNEYLGKSKRFGHWRDTHIKVRGDAVAQLELRFVMDWNFCSTDVIHLRDGFFPRTSGIPRGVAMQIISSGPDTAQHNIHYAYVKMISEADKSIYIQTPYFVPDDAVFESLKIAALSGIDVRIMIPAKKDHPFVHWANLSYLGELVEVGVKCYLYQKGFVHSKMVLVDSLVSSIGTANMDIRSFKLNFEVNAFLYDAQVTKALEEQYLRDIEDSSQLTMEEYAKRSHAVKVKESISRLLSPLL
jgi:cardiolipin synthase